MNLQQYIDALNSALVSCKSGEGREAVKQALEGLRARQPSLIWKSARSEYAVEDAAMLRWYAQRVAAGTWPPVGPQLDWLDE